MANRDNTQTGEEGDGFDKMVTPHEGPAEPRPDGNESTLSGLEHGEKSMSNLFAIGTQGHRGGSRGGG